MRKKRSGVTLLEITIVMAVTAIVVTGVVSLCVSVQGVAARTNEVTDAIASLTGVRDMATKWIAHFDGLPGATVTALADSAESGEPSEESNKTILRATVEGNNYDFYLDKSAKKFVAQYEGKTLYANADTVIFLGFDCCTSDNLIVCSVTYTLTKSNGKLSVEETSFVIAARGGTQ